jgi:hypothetical protein
MIVPKLRVELNRGPGGRLAAIDSHDGLNLDGLMIMVIP